MRRLFKRRRRMDSSRIQRKEIDKETWNRKEHFDFFLNQDLPFYNITFQLDVSGLRPWVKSQGFSFTNTMIHLTTKTMMTIENFLYRYEDGKIYLYSHLDPSITYLKKGEELFRMINLKWMDELGDFDRNSKRLCEESREFLDFSGMDDRSNFVFISAIPWLPFTALDHTMKFDKDDSVPRVSWGKVESRDGKESMPYNMRVNHIFIDGLHLGQFYEHLMQNIQALIENQSIKKV
jgi:chloramphenicol O-acetyltransferase type A